MIFDAEPLKILRLLVAASLQGGGMGGSVGGDEAWHIFSGAGGDGVAGGGGVEFKCGIGIAPGLIEVIVGVGGGLRTGLGERGRVRPNRRGSAVVRAGKGRGALRHFSVFPGLDRSVSRGGSVFSRDRRGSFDRRGTRSWARRQARERNKRPSGFLRIGMRLGYPLAGLAAFEVGRLSHAASPWQLLRRDFRQRRRHRNAAVAKRGHILQRVPRKGRERGTALRALS